MTDSGIVMLAPVSVHADYFRRGIGTAMLNLGIQKVKELGYKGITVEGNYKFYNRVGFRTSSEYNIFPTSGYPMKEPRCMMCQETYEGSLDGVQGIGTAMLNLGIQKVKELGYKGITVEGNYKFYNRVGFRTSSEYNIFPTSGYPMKEPRCMMCQETYEGSLDGVQGYIVYDMYYNA